MTKQEAENFYKAAVREHGYFEDNRKNRGLGNAYPGSARDKLLGWVEKLKAGQAELGDAEVAAWIANLEQRAAEAAVLVEAVTLFDAEAEVEGATLRIDSALRICEKYFPDDPKRCIQGWDAAKKLIARYRDPKFVGVEEVQVIVTRYEAVEPKMTTELPLKVAAAAVAKLVKAAEYEVERLERETDNRSESSVLAARRDLREKLAPLAAHASHPDAAAFLARCDAAFAASEKALGDKIVIPEIQAAERIVAPLLDRVERAIGRKVERAMREHGARLRARAGALAPLVKHQRIELLQERVERALRQVPQGDDREPPQFAIDVAADSRVQAKLAEINRLFAEYREARDTGLAAFEDDVDLMTGAYGRRSEDIGSEMSRRLIDLARRAEAAGKQLAEIDATQPAVAVIAASVPKLVEQAQQLNDKLETTIKYADAMAAVERAIDRARRERQQAIDYGTDGPLQYWPDTLSSLDNVDEEADKAAAILPDDHDEADMVKAKAAALRAEAIEQMTTISRAEVAKYARNNQTYEAERYVAAMRAALPDSPVNEQLAAIVSGSANARQKAEADAEAARDKIRKQAASFSRQMKSTYDSWAEEKAPITALAGTIVRDIEQVRGKWVRHTYDLLGLWLADEPYRLDGDIYFLEFEPDFKAKLRGGLEKLDGWFGELATKIAQTNDAPISTTTQHYPKNADFVAEITGTATYAPKHEVRDPTGNLLYTIDGTPYPVPKLTVRAAWTEYCTVVPGVPTSVENIDPSSVLD